MSKITGLGWLKILGLLGGGAVMVTQGPKVLRSLSRRDGPFRTKVRPLFEERRAGV